MWITEGNWFSFCHTGKRKKDQLHSTTLPALQFAVVHFISYPLWKMATGYQVWCGLLFLCFFLAFTKPSKIPPLSTRATHFDPWWLATRLPGEAHSAHVSEMLIILVSFISSSLSFPSSSPSNRERSLCLLLHLCTGQGGQNWVELFCMLFYRWFPCILTITCL